MYAVCIVFSDDGEAEVFCNGECELWYIVNAKVVWLTKVMIIFR